MTTIDAQVIDTLKKAGLYDGLVAAIGKDATVGDVHVSSASDDTKNGKRKPLTFLEAFNAEDDTTDVDADVNKAADARILRPMDETMSHTPFPHDGAAMAKLRGDQVPKFLGAISDPSKLEDKSLSLKSLVSMQDRVDPEKVKALQSAKSDPPVVTRFGGRNYIADGHHRAAAAWMNGDNTINTKFADISANNNEVKPETDDTDEFEKNLDWSIPVKITKVIPDQQLIFGWASVVEKNGKLIIDKQGHMITPSALEDAAYDFMLNAREQGDMHVLKGVGRVIESMVFTIEKQDALGIQLKNEDGDRIVGWWIGSKVDNADVWADHKAGKRPEFSIGGSGILIPV